MRKYECAVDDSCNTVHYLTKKKSKDILPLFITLCGQKSGLYWRRTVQAKATCLKCEQRLNSENLKDLGGFIRRAQTAFLKQFKLLSEKCEHRRAYQYRRPNFLSWMCTKKTDPFDWGCEPDSCPFLGDLTPTSSEWQEIEDSPTKEDL